MLGWLTRRNLLALLAAVAVLAATIYPLFRHLAMKGLQAEAHLMLSYISSLESAYYLDKNQYAFFEEYYGSPIKGRDNCIQPAGAEHLGFLIRWCHKEKNTPARYAFRVAPTGVPNEFRAEAFSGSDENDQSFICFGENEDDAWQIDEKRQLKRIKNCD